MITERLPDDPAGCAHESAASGLSRSNYQDRAVHLSSTGDHVLT